MFFLVNWFQYRKFNRNRKQMLKSNIETLISNTSTTLSDRNFEIYKLRTILIVEFLNLLWILSQAQDDKTSYKHFDTFR